MPRYIIIERDALTIGDKLDNYVKRYGGLLTSAKIAEPSVRALFWKRYVWQLTRERDRYWDDDPKWEAVADVLRDAKKRHSDIILDMISARTFRRAFSVPAGASTTREMEGV